MSIREAGLVSTSFFFFNDTATTEIYTLSLHDALPISASRCRPSESAPTRRPLRSRAVEVGAESVRRSEEHTSELQSHSDLVCRLLLEKKKKQIPTTRIDDHNTHPNPKHHGKMKAYIIE